MVHTFKTSNLTVDLEIHQHLGSLKHVINVIMWIRDTGCYMRLRVMRVVSLRRSREVKAEDGQIDAMGYITSFYPMIIVFIILCHKGIVVF
jgi:hypothetical protein